MAFVKITRPWQHGVIVWCVLMAVYLITMPRTVTMEDSGALALYAQFDGVCHPPGYPLYARLGSLFAQLPFGELAFRLNLMSACFAALAGAMIWWIVYLLTLPKPTLASCYFASLGFGLSHTLWSQAIIAEVYTLNAFLFFLFFAQALLFYRTEHPRHLLACALIGGLGLSNHYPLFLLAATGCLVLFLHRWRTVLRFGHWVFLFVALGLTPYLDLYFKLMNGASFSFCEPQESLWDFWFFVSRKNYSSIENVVTAGFADKIAYAGHLARRLFLEATPLTGLLAAVGITALMRSSSRLLGWVTSISFLGGTLFLVGLVHFNYDIFWQSVFRVYPIISYGFWLIWAALGWAWLEPRLGRLKDLWLALLILSIGTCNWGDNDRRHDQWAADFARATLNSLPPNAVYFTDADMDVGPLAYSHLMTSLRPDVTLYNDKGLGFGNRLMDALRTEPEEILQGRRDQQQALHNFITRSTRPVFYTNENMPHPYGTTTYGMFRQVDRSGSANSGDIFAINDDLVEYYARVLARDDLRDPWSLLHRQILIGKIADGLTGLIHDPARSRAVSDRHKQLLSQAKRHYLGALRHANRLILLGHPDLDGITLALQQAEKLLGPLETRSNSSKLLTLQALHLDRLGQSQKALQKWEASVATFAHHDNPAVRQLVMTYRRGQHYRKLAALKKRFPHLFDDCDD